jgi:hypothetical protein
MPIRHFVLLKFKSVATEAIENDIEQEFSLLPMKIPGITGFEWGLNISPENLDKGYSHAFTLTFEDVRARDDYLMHPAHLDFVKRLYPVVEDVLVIEYMV